MDPHRSCKWWNEGTVAVVTGANKGIGLEVCRQFATCGLNVILTARDADKGQKSAESLNNEGFQNVTFHQLDVTDKRSCFALASWLSEEHGGIDILVNNAGINGLLVDEAYMNENDIKLEDLMKEEHRSKGFIIEYESAKACVDTNYYGAKYVIEALLPLLRFSAQGARVVNVGSNFGLLKNLNCSKLQQKLSDLDNLSEAFLDELMKMYLTDVKQKSWEGKCWPLHFPSYKMSKVALHAYTRLLALQVQKKYPTDVKVFVNCVHPGFVRTDITGGRGRLSVQEGAENIVRVALLPPAECPSGQLFLERQLGVF
ncbi:hypothetical protein KP509_24G002100 [Ceratopteris richardii]|uniref:Uncharacterized protein n=1 Tax=Ceratopteris richardii TaxID=49495 RepID=A0A8T2RUS9_CERRI|nr:hypothetical protein KP509_24G002100 [Ceratopteris richardii]